MIKQYSHLCASMKLALLLCLFTCATPHAQADNADAEQALVIFNQHHNMLALSSGKPLLQIFANGLVTVHRPEYLQDAGDFEFQLSRAELAHLMSRLQALNLHEFNARKTRLQIARLERAESNGHSMHAWSDHTYTSLWLRYPNDANRDTRLPLQWSNVGGDARRYPQLQALQNLAAAEQTLTQLIWHKDLRPLALSGNTTSAGELK